MHFDNQSESKHLVMEASCTLSLDASYISNQFPCGTVPFVGHLAFRSQQGHLWSYGSGLHAHFMSVTRLIHSLIQPWDGPATKAYWAIFAFPTMVSCMGAFRSRRHFLGASHIPEKLSVLELLWIQECHSPEIMEATTMGVGHSSPKGGI